MRRAVALLDRAQTPIERVLLETCRSGIAWFAGRWRAAAETARNAIELHRRERGRYDFELAIARGYRVSTMVLLGDLAGARTETLAAIEDAASAATSTCCGCSAAATGSTSASATTIRRP